MLIKHKVIINSIVEAQIERKEIDNYEWKWQELGKNLFHQVHCENKKWMKLENYCSLTFLKEVELDNKNEI